MKKLSFILILLVSGCWNYRELNDLAIVTSIAIDKKDNNYEVSTLIINDKNKATVYSSSDKTIAQALKKINLKLPKELYLGHLGTIIVSEDVAKEGLKNILDYFLRDPETIKQFYLVIAKKYKAKNILSTSSSLESFGQSINSSLTSSSNIQGISTNVDYNKFVENLLKKGKEQILPTITLTNNSKIKLDTISILKNGKLLGFTNKQESQGINILLNQTDEVSLSYKCNDGYITSNISNIKTKTKINNSNIFINIKVDAKISEITCSKISNIKNNIKKELNREIKSGIRIAKKYKADIFGFGNLFYKKYPNYFKKNKWNENIFPNINIYVKTSINLKNTGSIKKTLKGDHYD